MYSIDVLMSPAEHGYIECNYCNGLGSLDMIKPKHIICSVCDGSGILKIKSRINKINKTSKFFQRDDKKELFMA